MEQTRSLCCRDLDSTLRESIPFKRMLILDYYEGPSRAITFCEVCDKPFLAVMIDWSEDHLTRVFGLTPLPASLLDKVLAIFSEVPRWPMWFPSQLIAPTDEVRLGLDSLEEGLKMLSPPTMLLGWSVQDNQPLICQAVSGNESGSLANWFESDENSPRTDWVGQLGLD